MLKNDPYNFPEGEVLLIDKPLHWTSFDVVNKIRYKIRHTLHLKKIKVGHAGTLDPLATGLLIVCTGKETKKIDSYQSQVKEYTGSFELGRETPSYDLETETSKTHSLEGLTEEKIHETAKTFLGKQQQMPPRFSAKKIDGKRAYTYARNQEEVKMKSREVEIFDFEIEKIQFPKVTFRVTCSKGTYIRSLAHDFGQALNNGACLVSLRRTKIGDFTVKNALSMDQFGEVLDRQQAPRETDAVIFDFNRTIYDPKTEKLMEGAVRLIHHLQKRKVKLALLTRTTDDKRRQLIKSLGLDSLFDEIVLTEEKKQEHHFFSLTKKMDVAAERCVVLGDRVKSEIVIGNKLGMKTIWLRRGKFKKEIPEIPEEQPTYTINNLHEAYHYL